MYDLEFYKKYQEYLLEPAVRNFHDSMFSIFWSFSVGEHQKVLDLGCGACCEFQAFQPTKKFDYIGVDKNKDATNSKNTIIVGDYVDRNLLKDLFKSHPNINAVVSLFSIECCLKNQDRYDLYRDLFELSDIGLIMSSGFYYKGREGEEKVIEAGGIESYQTIDEAPREFLELRAILNVPSNLFGPDVFEVWKIIFGQER